MHKCEDIKKLETEKRLFDQDPACLEYIATQYIPVIVKGHGQGGIALLLGDPKDVAKMIIVKILKPSSSTRYEIELSCDVTEKFKDSSFFIKIYGWLVCGPPPPSWINSIDRYRKNPTTKTNKIIEMEAEMYYLFMEEADIAIANYRFVNISELLSIIFQTLYAIYWARNTEPLFWHGDLHCGNVMLKKQPLSGVWVESVYFEPIHTAFQIKIIDYGNVSFFKPPDPTSKRDDVLMFLEVLCESADMQNPDVKEFMRTNLLHLTKDIYREELTVDRVLLSNFFSSLRANGPTKEPTALKDCIVCGFKATRVMEHNRGYRFCANDSCLKRMGAMIHLV